MMTMPPFPTVSRALISNFRSLGQNVDIQFGALTALVGPNGSGKSSVADALRFVANALRTGIEAAITDRHGIVAVRRWSAGRPFDVSIRLEVASPTGTGHYEFVLGDRKGGYRVKHESAHWSSPESSAGYEVVEGHWTSGPSDLRPKVSDLALVLPLVAGDARFRPLADALRNVEIYSVFPDTLREPQKPDPAKPMQQHGRNWGSILKGMREESWLPELRAALGRLTGDIDDVRVKQIGGYLFAEFRHVQTQDTLGPRREKWFDAAQESDGTLRFAGILTALLQEPPLTLVGIEEPELTVHNGALPLLHDYLRQSASRGQVLVTTHSPDLIDLFDSDDVRVVERIDGVTAVQPLEDAQRQAVKERLLSLGDLVRMEGLRPQRELPVESPTSTPLNQRSFDY